LFTTRNRRPPRSRFKSDGTNGKTSLHAGQKEKKSRVGRKRGGGGKLGGRLKKQDNNNGHVQMGKKRSARKIVQGLWEPITQVKEKQRKRDKGGENEVPRNFC